MKYPSHLNKVIDVLRRLPGVGTKSAERFAFNMLNWPKHHIQEMAHVINAIPEQIRSCQTCGCLMDDQGCLFCNSPHRDPKLMCLIASPRDAYAVEETGEYRGLYHVLGGLLSPLDNRHADDLQIPALLNRLQKEQTRELIIALDSTIEGDATALFLQQELSELPISITRLAFGLPMGSSLDYVDGGTLARALSNRV